MKTLLYSEPFAKIWLSPTASPSKCLSDHTSTLWKRSYNRLLLSSLRKLFKFCLDISETTKSFRSASSYSEWPSCSFSAASSNSSTPKRTISLTQYEQNPAQSLCLDNKYRQTRHLYSQTQRNPRGRLWVTGSQFHPTALVEKSARQLKSQDQPLAHSHFHLTYKAEREQRVWYEDFQGEVRGIKGD